MSKTEIKEFQAGKIKVLNDIAKQNVKKFVSKINKGEKFVFRDVQSDLQKRLKEQNTNLTKNFNVYQESKILERYENYEWDSDPLLFLDDDPPPIYEELLSIYEVTGKALNIYCTKYLEMILLHVSINKINLLFDIIKGLTTLDPAVQRKYTWTDIIMTKIIKNIYYPGKERKEMSEKEILEHETIIQQCVNLFDTLMKIKDARTQKWAKFAKFDVTHALWIETDNFNKQTKVIKNILNKDKLERVSKLLRDGANVYEPRDKLFFVNSPDFGNKITNNNYRKLPFVMPIYLYNCFYNKNTSKTISENFNRITNQLFGSFPIYKVEKSYYRKNPHKKIVFLDQFLKSLNLCFKEGIIDNRFGQYEALHALISDEIDNLTKQENAFGYRYNFGYTNGFDYADEYDYDSEFGSSGGGSFDDNYGFGASGAEYDDYDDY